MFLPNAKPEDKELDALEATEAPLPPVIILSTEPKALPVNRVTVPGDVAKLSNELKALAPFSKIPAPDDGLVNPATAGAA